MKSEVFVVLLWLGSSEPEESGSDADWTPASAEEIPRFGVMVDSSQSHMSVQSAQATESSRNYSSVEMRSDQESSSYSSSQPQSSMCN